MTPALLTLITFLAASAAVAGVASLWNDLYGRNRERINDRFQKELRDQDGVRQGANQLFQMDPASLEEPTLWARMEQMLEASQIRLSLREVLLLSVAAGLMAMLAVRMATQSWLAGLPIGLLVTTLPAFYVRSRSRARLRKLGEQLPEAFDIMSRAVRAGQSLTSAMQLIADDLEPPLSEEFAYCHQQQTLGLSQEIALRELARRSGIIELQMLVVALLVQQRSGGNLVELLENLSTVIRKRLLLQGKIKALTSEGRMQAAVLIVLPVLMFLAMYFLNRSYAEVLLDRPWLLAGTFVSALVGATWIVRIVQIDY